jgi:glycosyltransferase involved in cell wall biosynthesis
MMSMLVIAGEESTDPGVAGLRTAGLSMRNIKVAWDNCLARRNQTGTGVYAARLLEHLTQRTDLFVEIFDGWPNGSAPKTRLERAVHAAGNLAWIHARLPFRLRGRRFDLLHSPAFISPIACPCPRVITVHDIAYLLYPSHFARWWVSYLKLLMPTVLGSAGAVICGSEHSKDELVKTYGLPPTRVHAVPYGVDHQRFRPDADLDKAWVRQLGLREGYILHVSDLSYRKNIPALLRAVAHLRSGRKWGDRQVVLAGSESPGMFGAAEARDVIGQLELQETVILTGRVPDEHLPGLYAHAALLVMPSLYEGFGFPVVESMAAGTPVVASNSSSLPEVAGDAAILVPPQSVEALANAISEVLENGTLSEEMRRKGVKQASRFSWERAAAETVAVYRSVARS